MMSYTTITGLMMAMMSLLIVSTRNKHILSILLSIELMILSIILLLSNSMMMKNQEILLIIPFICLSVCEAALGLSILIALTRMTGNDLMIPTTLMNQW